MSLIASQTNITLKGILFENTGALFISIKLKNHCFRALDFGLL